MEGSQDGGAKVIRFPDRGYLREEVEAARPKSCFVCIWSVVSGTATYCSLFTEQIENERDTAEDCGEYRDDKAKG